MLQENLELARRSYAALDEAMKTGEFLPVIETFCHREIVLKPSGPLMPETSEMRGHDGALRFLTLQMQAFERFSLRPQEFIDAGEKVVVPVRFGGRAAHTGLDIEIEAVHVWTPRDQKWIPLDMYLSKPEALEAVGLRE